MFSRIQNRFCLTVHIIMLAEIFIFALLVGCGSDGAVGPEYRKTGDVYGTVKVSGSTTMSNVTSLWCKGFSDIYHDVNCIVESFGSGKAPKDLMNGKVDFGAMSEPMSSQDKADFMNKYGYEPLEIKVAIDMIAVLVNPENPISCITTIELDGIYSKSYQCQGAADITTWGGLDLTGEWVNTPIKLYGRTPSSGTYKVFRNSALCGGSYKKSMTELASSRDIVEFVSRDFTSIGYSGIGLLNPRVKAVSVGDTTDSCYAPNASNAASGKYPFTRNLYIYTKENPVKGMEKSTEEFLKFILSREGQEAAIEAGLVNLPASQLKEEMKKLSN